MDEKILETTETTTAAEETPSMKDMEKELKESYKYMGDGEHDTDTLLAWEKVQGYLESKETLTVVISGVVNKGVIAEVEGLRGFIPASRLDLRHVEDTNEWLNKEIQVRVIQADMKSNKLVLSAREILREAEKEARKAKMSDIKVGAVVEGTVESIQPYGAFVDLGEHITGLVHISQISVKRIKHPGDVLKEGDKIQAKVVKNQDGKIGLSIKALAEPAEAPVREKEEKVVIPKAESIGTSLGDLFKNLNL